MGGKRLPLKERMGGMLVMAYLFMYIPGACVMGKDWLGKRAYHGIGIHRVLYQGQTSKGKWKGILLLFLINPALKVKFNIIRRGVIWTFWLASNPIHRA